MSDTAIVPTEPAQLAPLDFTPEQRTMIRGMFAKDAGDPEFAVLMEVARLKRLNPIIGQCHFVSRNENLASPGEPPRWSKKWSVQTGIDGFRAKAEEHQAYDGQSEKQWTYAADQKTLVSCKVSVFRKDRAKPFTAECFFSEYAFETFGRTASRPRCGRNRTSCSANVPRRPLYEWPSPNSSVVSTPATRSRRTSPARSTHHH